MTSLLKILFVIALTLDLTAGEECADCVVKAVFGDHKNLKKV